jgi:hypothetical protein
MEMGKWGQTKTIQFPEIVQNEQPNNGLRRLGKSFQSIVRLTLCLLFHGYGRNWKMTDVLIRIKRAVLAGRYAFSEKARIEMEVDGITE